MNITTSARLRAKSDNDTVFPSVSGSENGGAGVPRAGIVEGVRAMNASLWYEASQVVDPEAPVVPEDAGPQLGVHRDPLGAQQPGERARLAGQVVLLAGRDHDPHRPDALHPLGWEV